MKIEDLVDLLIGDLSNEYAHMHFYIQASTNVTGPHRLEIGEFFAEQAQSEMKHVDEFRKLIQGVITRRGIDRKVPSLVAEFKDNVRCPKALLRAALEMEDKVVANYVLRLLEAECVGATGNPEDKIDATYIGLFLEDQILDSRGDADNIREMLENDLDPQ
jgi:ferritin-like protein